MTQQKTRRAGFRCPHCNSRASARSSREITALVRTLYYRCDNDACCHTFVAQLAVLHSVQPSLMPNPEVNLPLRVAATLAPLAAANDFAANDLPIAGLMDQLDTIAS